MKKKDTKKTIGFNFVTKFLNEKLLPRKFDNRTLLDYQYGNPT